VSEAPWQLRVMVPARRQLDRLPVAVVGSVIETLGAIEANPRRLGKPLHFELEGCFSARRGPYRIIYRIDEDARVVAVLAVAHRSDVYRPR
jgi:mRNA interferase RelE/StbE